MAYWQYLGWTVNHPSSSRFQPYVTYPSGETNDSKSNHLQEVKRTAVSMCGFQYGGYTVANSVQTPTQKRCFRRLCFVICRSMEPGIKYQNHVPLRQNTFEWIDHHYVEAVVIHMQAIPSSQQRFAWTVNELMLSFHGRGIIDEMPLLLLLVLPVINAFKTHRHLLSNWTVR